MPRCSLECWKSCLKSPDVFEHKEIHRYQNNSEYKSVCGGVCTILVFLILISLFLEECVNTINMNIIHSEITQSTEIEPEVTTWKLGPGGDMQIMLANNLMSLSAEPRLFDWELFQEHYEHDNFSF